MKKIIVLCIVSLMMCSRLKSQNIQVTKISNDVIILHPSEPRDLSVIREVGGTMTAVRTDEGLVIFDSFISPQAGEEARNILDDYFPDESIHYLVNSHHHADHVRGNQCFREACIIGHGKVETYIYRGL